MKQIITFFLFVFIVSCCGTKKAVDNSYKSEIKKEIIPVNKADSLVKKEIKVKEITQNVTENKLEETNNEFHQNLTKRFITTHQLWDELLANNVSNNGIVNYKSFKTEHKKLLNYIYVLSQLFSNKTFKTLAKNEKLAFWINAYNAMTIDLILRHYPVKSIKDINNPWKQRLWKLGSKWYNLNDIEHQILRKMNEPRIHFAIVCASVSCPKLLNEAYSASSLEQQLTKATKDFLNDSTKNNISESNLKLSKIFQWFSKDFQKNSGLIDFLNRYSEVKISKNAKKSFNDYNWSLNE